MLYIGGSGGSSGRAVGYHLRGLGFDYQPGPSQIFSAPLCPPSTKWPKVSDLTALSRRTLGAKFHDALRPETDDVCADTGRRFKIVSVIQRFMEQDSPGSFPVIISMDSGERLKY
ncbi:hypothetical protein PoB_002950700 [Plakobranchus ocellatus]|uniref:Uncharacterized protein n=1 Tax=Plakobranchus ocellatus TaxID=259542 RepID=A0AAV4A7V8_9GAST|nr:hypothetical protein PoB_002950700 [Plakobranchus ocellatus]